MRYVMALLCLLVGLVSCQPSAEMPTLSITPIESPAANHSALPSLTTGPAGQLYLSWVEQESREDTAFLKFAHLQAEGWSEPLLIAQGNNWFVNWADFPSLAVSDSFMVGHWLQKSTEGTYDYDVRLAFSYDQGHTWSDSFIAHNDNVSAEHGFVSMESLPNGQLFAAWLDGRNTKQEGGAMTLHAAIFDQAGQRLEDWELDTRICDCCQTGATLTPSGPLVVYRDRSESEVRDIYQVRWTNEGWTQPQVVSVDNWQIKGCPVNGPAVSAYGNRVAVAWFTAADDKPTIRAAWSEDQGATYSRPMQVSRNAPMGRVDVAMLANGYTVVTWVEASETGGKLMLGLWDAAHQPLGTTVISSVLATRASGFPKVLALGNRIAVTWTQHTDEVPSVELAWVDILEGK
ncbi:MAG: exo-alpha-sialidase [Bacteroidota bacterium]